MKCSECENATLKKEKTIFSHSKFAKEVLKLSVLTLNNKLDDSSKQPSLLSISNSDDTTVTDNTNTKESSHKHEGDNPIYHTPESPNNVKQHNTTTLKDLNKKLEQNFDTLQTITPSMERITR